MQAIYLEPSKCRQLGTAEFFKKLAKLSTQLVTQKCAEFNTFLQDTKSCYKYTMEPKNSQFLDGFSFSKGVFSGSSR